MVRTATNAGSAHSAGRTKVPASVLLSAGHIVRRVGQWPAILEPRLCQRVRFARLIERPARAALERVPAHYTPRLQSLTAARLAVFLLNSSPDLRRVSS